jgi:nicotinamidase-related amidase
VIVFVQAIAHRLPVAPPEFANTDLDFQLRQCGIEKIIVAGIVANTCIEATTRCAAELGYQVTLVRAATAAHMAEEAGLGTVGLGKGSMH